MKDYPIIRVASLFIAGIILNKYSSSYHDPFLLLTLGIISLFLIVVLFDNKNKIRYLLNIIIIITLIGTGFAAESISKINKEKFSINKDYIENVKVYGKISNIELNKRKGILFEVCTDSIVSNNYFSKIKANILCRLNDYSKRRLDSVYALISPGNMIRIEGYYSKGRDRRNPGEFDYNNYLHSEGISGVLNSYSINQFDLINQNKDRTKSIIFSIRKYLNKSISSLFETQTAALVKGLLLADKSEIDQEAKVDFINSGVMHVLAVSGLHVGFLAFIFIFLFGRLNIYIRSILTIAGLILFMVITGMPASVVRSVVMFNTVIISLLTNRGYNINNSLALAALSILLFSPNELFNPGFQMSFASVFSIGAIYPYFRDKVKSLRIKFNFIKSLLLLIGVTLSAQIGTFPFIIVYFYKLSVISIFANIIVIPAIGIVVSISFFTLAVNVISPFVASISAITNNIVASLIFEFVKFTGRLQYSFLWIRNFTIIDSLIFYLFLIVLFFSMNKLSNFISKMILMILVFTNMMVFCTLDYKDLLSKNLLNVYSIDVGQGDAFLIKFPNGKTAIIDAGFASIDFDNGEKIIDPLLGQFGIKKIDYAFISHFDIDHYGGFVSLIENKRIDKIFIPEINPSINKETKFRQFLIQNKIQLEYYTKKSISVGNSKIYILNDTQKFNTKATTSNNRSGIIRIMYGKTSILFTGDIDKIGEKYYARRYGKFLNSDVLKISHHGSSFCSSDEFLSQVEPKISLISVGIKNKFGHPSREVLDRLEKHRSRILRTDKCGGILLKSDGQEFTQVEWKS